MILVRMIFFFEFEQGYLRFSYYGWTCHQRDWILQRGFRKNKKNIRIYLLFYIKLAHEIRNLGQMKLLKK